MRSPREYSISIVVRFSFNSYTIHKTHAKVLSHLSHYLKCRPSFHVAASVSIFSHFGEPDPPIQQIPLSTKQIEDTGLWCGCFRSQFQCCGGSRYRGDTRGWRGSLYGNAPLARILPIAENTRLVRRLILLRRSTWLARITLRERFLLRGYFPPYWRWLAYCGSSRCRGNTRGWRNSPY